MISVKQDDEADEGVSSSASAGPTIPLDTQVQVGPREADSLSPILKSFQGVTLLDGFYYFQGDASPEELVQASSIATSIVQYTLTDFPKNANRKVKPGTIIRLVQLLSSVMQGPLFPNLALLRIYRAESSADQLNMFLTPSLKKLELISLPSDRQEEFRIFLELLAVIAKDMESLKLRGLTQQRPTVACLNFKQLLHLDIGGSAPISLSFLEDIGKLPLLQSFHLDATKSIYIAQSNPASDSDDAGMNLFLKLSKLHIICTHDIAQDLLRIVPSGVLCDISLTFCRSKVQSPQPTITKQGAKGVASSSPAPAISITHVSEIVESALRKWRETLVSVGTNIPEDPFFPAVLSPTIISLLMDLNLQQLKISGWGIPSSFDIVKAVLKTKGPTLQVLHLPNKQNTDVTLPRLTEIAEGLPALIDLRCTLDLNVLSDESKPIYFPKNPLSHPLKVLDVGTIEPVNVAQLPPLARFIDYLFPNVEKLDMASQGDSVDGKLLKVLVRLCQDARKDEASRMLATNADRDLDHGQGNIIV